MNGQCTQATVSPFSCGRHNRPRTQTVSREIDANRERSKRKETESERFFLFFFPLLGNESSKTPTRCGSKRPGPEKIEVPDCDDWSSITLGGTG